MRRRRVNIGVCIHGWCHHGHYLMLHVDFVRALVLTVVVFQEEELNQQHLLLATSHIGHRPLGGVGDVGLEDSELVVSPAFLALDRVLEVNEEGQVHAAAIAIAFLAKDFESGAGEGGFVERFGGDDLIGCFVFILWHCSSSLLSFSSSSIMT